MLNEAPGDQPLIPNPLQEEFTVLVTDKIYHQAYQYMQVCNIVLLLYALAKLVATPYYAFTIPFSHMTFFLAALFLASLLQLLTCRLTSKALRNRTLYYQIAELLGHARELNSRELPDVILNASYRISQTYDYSDAEAEEDERRMKVLYLEIRYHVQQSNKRLNRMSKVQFAVHQVVHLWGLLLLFFYDFQQKTLETYVIIVMVMGAYQYLQIYILVLFVIVILPFFAIKQLYHYLISKYKAYKLQQILKSQPFSEQLKGDHECKICLMPYQASEEVIVLKCSEMHNFHSGCFREWAKTASTCPLCRKDITNF